MRALIVVLALAAAAPASAQVARGIVFSQDAQRLAEAQAARSRDIVTTNELSTLQAQAQTNQALSDIGALRARPAVPAVAPGPHGPAARIDTSKFASIPDAALAASYARVRAAAENRR
jgi:hypothetical protein